MREAGVGQVADVLFFAFMVVFGSSLLVLASPVELDESTRGYAASLARSTLLSFQQASVDELGELSYNPGLQVSWESELGLRHKTPVQLILEDALLNPQVEIDGRRVALELNREFDESVRDFLRGALDRLVRGRFGYRLEARMTPLELSSGVTLRFDMVVADFDENSRQLCSESVSMALPAPEGWLGAQLEEENALLSQLPEGSFQWFVNALLSWLEPPDSVPRPVVTVTLELWSK